jgi:DNA mismatch repair protein MutL
MSKISILPDFLINKIAAGEVIERPASVVRELIDNSIDAGAKTISVDVLYGGKKLMKIADDGCGMDREDALLCFERHATSKIQTEDNLFNITTLGFRGEALSSIASVSKIVLVTSSQNSGSGTKVEFGVNRIVEVSDAPPVRGTTIEVRDIFYNTPARRKFLKSNATELSHIIDIVTRKALASPGVSFSLSHNGGEILNVTPAATLRERFEQLYGDDLVREFIETKGEGTGIHLYGFCSSPAFLRSSRGNQVIFVNSRPVRNPAVSHAVYSAYRDVIQKDRHPAFFLFLDIDPLKVDVNVHPAKREVRFESSEDVHRLVMRSIQEGLSPSGQIETGHASIHEQSEVREKWSYSESVFGDRGVRETLESALGEPGAAQPDFFDNRIAPEIRRFFYIGDSFFAHISGNGLVIIDQHAAHERVMYENLLKKTGLEIEQFFLPFRVDLPVKEYTVIMNRRDIFSDFGIEIADFGQNNVIVRTLPKELGKSDVKGLLMDTASRIMEKETIGIKDDTEKQELIQSIAAGLACHRSVRGKEQMTDEELSRLVSDLEKTDIPDKCPHGRPTRVFLTLDDLSRMFKRK